MSRISHKERERILRIGRNLGTGGKPEAQGSLAAPSGSAIREQSVAEVPDSPRDTQKWALRIISLSQRDNFQDDYDWAKWCRTVAGAGLMKDGDKLERLEQVVWRVSPNAKLTDAGPVTPGLG